MEASQTKAQREKNEKTDNRHSDVQQSKYTTQHHHPRPAPAQKRESESDPASGLDPKHQFTDNAEGWRRLLEKIQRRHQHLFHKWHRTKDRFL